MSDGTFTTLLGPSGCGKTTTLRCIAGLEIPDAGEITMKGRTLFSLKDNTNVPAHKRNMGMVFQSYAIWPHMNVFENVAFPLKVRKLQRTEIQERVKKILDLVKLAGLENRPATQLSGGQQQRVALARSLVMEPQLLLLDEPLSNLDYRLREEMRIELKDLQRRLKITTLYVTHDQSEAFSLSDDIKIIFDGKIVAEGSPQKIYSSPEMEKVAEFLGCRNKMPAKVKAFQSKEGLTLVETPIGEITVRVPKNLKEGDTFNLYVRPVRITIYHNKPRNDVNVFKGKVKHAFLIGSDHVEYHIAVKDQILTAKGNLVPDIDTSKEIFFVINPESSLYVSCNSTD